MIDTERYQQELEALRHEAGGSDGDIARARALGSSLPQFVRSLVGLDRDINKNFRIGVGYNFTDFSDDLTDFDYDHRGWFLNLVGTY